MTTGWFISAATGQAKYHILRVNRWGPSQELGLLNGDSAPPACRTEADPEACLSMPSLASRGALKWPLKDLGGEPARTDTWGDRLFPYANSGAHIEAPDRLTFEEVLGGHCLDGAVSGFMNAKSIHFRPQSTCALYTVCDFCLQHFSPPPPLLRVIDIGSGIIIASPYMWYSLLQLETPPPKL